MMQVSSLENALSTTTFKDFDIKGSVLCKNLPAHSHPDTAPIKKQPPQILKEEKEHKDKLSKKIAPLIGAAAGTVLPVIFLNRLKGKSLNTDILKNGKFLEKLKELGEYFEIENVRDILATAGGAVAGGLIGGFITDKDKESRKEKVKEGVFEITNIAVPTLIASGALELMKSKGLNKGFLKFIPFIAGLGAGIPLGEKISNTISKHLFKDEKEPRKFKPADLLVHTDDIAEMLVLLKIPFAKKLQIDKLLALIYAKCGFEAGSKDKENKASGHCH